MYKIQTLNNISPVGLERLPGENYQVGDDVGEADAILVRSTKMHDMDVPSTLRAIGRAGAGVNNIPVDKMSGLGIPVFNAPGANANAVKELVVAGMLLACRNICQAWDFARGLEGDDAAIHKAVEAGKKNFGGFELPGRTLGVVGLGAIGVKVANVAVKLGMKVVGYDPSITVQSAWKLSSEVQQAHDINDLYARSDFLTFHVPLIDATKNILNPGSVGKMRDNVVVMNFARDGVVDEKAVMDGIDSGKVYTYVCDFPSNIVKGHSRVIALPHLGASTREAEENCAIMVADQVKDYLENGNIHNSVNFPEVNMPRTDGAGRLAVVNSNVPNMVGQISTALANANLNIVDMLNKSRGDIAYTLIDVEGDVPDSVQKDIAGIDGVITVRIVGAA